MARTRKGWPELRWDEVADRASKCVFRLHAGSSAGTGFLVALGTDPRTRTSFATLATAWHVLEGLPGTSHDLEILSANGETVYSSAANRVGFYPLGEVRYDTALIVVQTGDPLLRAKDLLPLFPYESVLARGTSVCWIGFPGIFEPEPCFFHGHVSGYLNDPPTYLVDGVAVNGVSGGPVLDSRAHVIGIVSAYIPNRLDKNTTLPGVMAVVPINAVRYWFEHRLRAKVLRKSDLVSRPMAQSRGP